MTLLSSYQRDVEDGHITPDPGQKIVLDKFQLLHDELCRRNQARTGLLQRIAGILPGNTPRPVTGIYLWGGVGRGKTYLADLFYESLPFNNRLRIHFHRFMQRIHSELNRHRNVQDPLLLVADNLANDTCIICFDEFQVSDITDAMLLGGLFHALFERGITLVATSNVEPDKLYWDGLQRERFLPAIELVKKHTDVIRIDVQTDYRLRFLDVAEIYHHPLDLHADKMLERSFLNIAPDKGRVNSTIEIENRKIPVVRFADGVVWFEFHELCDGPRGVQDYIEIARQFQTVLISNVTEMNDDCNDVAKRFINMIDEFYDRNVKLLVTAETDIAGLYTGSRLAQVFTRTSSRLTEMQSHEYLARAHLLQ